MQISNVNDEKLFVFCNFFVYYLHTKNVSVLKFKKFIVCMILFLYRFVHINNIGFIVQIMKMDFAMLSETFLKKNPYLPMYINNLFGFHMNK